MVRYLIWFSAAIYFSEIWVHIALCSGKFELQMQQSHESPLLNAAEGFDSAAFRNREMTPNCIYIIDLTAERLTACCKMQRKDLTRRCICSDNIRHSAVNGAGRFSKSTKICSKYKYKYFRWFVRVPGGTLGWKNRDKKILMILSQGWCGNAYIICTTGYGRFQS